jgi:hypothetical protein
LPPWAEQVTECCQLRCPSLVERVEQAGPPPQRLLLVLDGVLDQLVAAGDGPSHVPDVRSMEQPERSPRGI